MSRKNLVAVVHGPWHPGPGARRAFTLLLRRGGLPLVRRRSLAVVTDADLEAAAAVVLYFQETEPAPGSIEGLSRWVEAGGGLVAVHAASASYKTEPAWTRLLGGRFLTHGPLRSFTVGPAGSGEPLSAGTEPFTVRDELYLHEWSADARVLLVTDTDGGPQPVAWALRQGAGRVFYLALGHTASSVSSAGFSRAFSAGLAWAAGGAS
jgi:uncharacterized protein